jgi:fructokinase
MKKYFGGIEAGGTHFNCIIANGPKDILAEIQLPTTDPTNTLSEVHHFFAEYLSSGKINIPAIGLGSFGPVDLNPESEMYGSITSTPKPGWQNIPILKILQKQFPFPLFFETDVNSAAIGEITWGAGMDVKNFLYITIGTGIGGGIMIDRNPVHGLTHPELGHIRIPHDLSKDPFPGMCPFHQDCFEGLASGPAMEKRWGTKAENLPIDHPAWRLETEYISLALHNFVCTLSPEKILLGGGVMQNDFLFPLIRSQTATLLNQYIHSSALSRQIDRFIVPPGLGRKAGSLGAIALAQQKFIPTGVYNAH